LLKAVIATDHLLLIVNRRVEDAQLFHAGINIVHNSNHKAIAS
jgi:hypothetical protein